MSEPSRTRLDAATRRALLVDAARAVFAERGYTGSGLAEVAERAEVSKTLLYHYFPDGRPELYRAVLDDLVAGLVGRPRTVRRAPVAPHERVARLVGALFDFFDEEPDAFRLLFLEPWGSGDPTVVGQAVGIRVQLGTELVAPLSLAGAGTERTMAAVAASTGALLQVCELWLAGQVDRQVAVDTADHYLRGGLASSGVLDLPAG